MAWWSNKEENKQSSAGSKAQTTAGAAAGVSSADVMLTRSGKEEDVILYPRITEKAAKAAENNVYTFNILPQATKKDVAQAVEKIYKVKPDRVRVVNIPSKTVMRRRHRGRKSRGKKAYVYLKPGDSIEFI